MGVVSKCTDKYQNCINECNRCYQACRECVTLCLREDDVAERDELIITLMECAEVCQVASRLMTMEAKHSKEICELCANVCNECAFLSSMFKDDHCIQCSDECKKCAKECKAIA